MDNHSTDSSNDEKEGNLIQSSSDPIVVSNLIQGSREKEVLLQEGRGFPEFFYISEKLFLIKEVEEITLVTLKLKPTESLISSATERRNSSSPATEKNKLRGKPLVQFLPHGVISFTAKGTVLES